jgi:hypothetical protein
MLKNSVAGIFQPVAARQWPGRREYDTDVADPRRGILRRRAVLDDSAPPQHVEGVVSSSVPG